MSINENIVGSSFLAKIVLYHAITTSVEEQLRYNLFNQGSLGRPNISQEYYSENKRNSATRVWKFLLWCQCPVR